ncbi:MULTISPECIES: zinc-ribbon domain-containing protein [unclassified Nocardioides]|uniref:zinc-ribbon domain-containing protein n=1 Tax=unclassified Nocardioides TaxID=2615069 RepID=UPI0009E8097C
MKDGTFIWFDGYEHHDVSHHPVWWKCPRGHEWQESLASMTARAAGAPRCTACKRP